MAKNHQLIALLIISSLFVSITATPPHDQTATTVAVEGMVYCQSCDRFGSWSLTGAEPIPGAKVSVICKNHKYRVSYYKSFETNAHGYFFAELNDFKMSHYLLDHPLHSCHVKLVSSPLDNCNLLSNINNGISGAPLRYENKMISGKDYEAVVYAAGPLAFRPATCH